MQDHDSCQCEILSQHFGQASQLKIAASRDMKKAKRSKDHGKEMEAEAETSKEDAGVLGAAAAEATWRAHRLEATAAEKAAEAGEYQEKADAALAEEGEDEAAVAAVEWIPFADAVADVVGGAVAAGLAADAATDESLAAERAAAASSANARAAGDEEEAETESKERAVKLKAAQEERAMAAEMRNAARTLVVGALKLIGDASVIQHEADQSFQTADDLKEKGKHLKDEASSLMGNIAKLKEDADSELEKAASLQYQATFLLNLAAFSAVLLMLSLWPAAFSQTELPKLLSVAQGHQAPLLQQQLDPRCGRETKWKWQMRKLETCALVTIFLWAFRIMSLYFEEDVQVGAWRLFAGELCAVGATSIIMAACTVLWACADLQKALSCGCLPSASKIIFRDAMTQLLWSGSNASIACLLGLYCYMGCHGGLMASLKAHGISWNHGTMREAWWALPMLALSLVFLRTACGSVRCGCACNMQPEPYQPGFLQRVAARVGGIPLILILMLVFVRKFYPFFKHSRQLAELSHMPPSFNICLGICMLLDIALLVCMILTKSLKRLTSFVLW